MHDQMVPDHSIPQSNEDGRYTYLCAAAPTDSLFNRGLRVGFAELVTEVTAGQAQSARRFCLCTPRRGQCPLNQSPF